MHFVQDHCKLELFNTVDEQEVEIFETFETEGVDGMLELDFVAGTSEIQA